jgi:hypothetical protein
VYRSRSALLNLRDTSSYCQGRPLSRFSLSHEILGFFYQRPAIEILFSLAKLNYHHGIACINPPTVKENPSFAANCDFVAFKD